MITVWVQVKGFVCVGTLTMNRGTTEPYTVLNAVPSLK